MKRDDVIILAATICAGIMIIISVIMVVFIGNNTDKLVSDTVEDAETNFVASGAAKEVPEEKTVIAVENSEPAYEQITDIILTEDEVDLAVEDTAIHEVVYENTYLNTIELVPSTRDEREVIPREDISQENFTHSFVGKEKCVVTIKTESEDGNIAQVTVSVPTEIFLYNVENEASNSCEVHAQISGDASLIKSLGWSSDDSAKLDFLKTSGEAVTIQRKADFTGDMKVTLLIGYYTAEKIATTEELEIIVHMQDMTDDTIRLYGMDGVALYTDKEGEKEAYLADYAKQKVFYGAVKTTGWQEIDGNTYYFTASGWPVTGMQIIGGTRYTFDEDGVLLSDIGERGIDVSRYQKDIDWEQVAASGIHFAIIRCGFRGSVNGRLVEDSYFKRNIEGAKKAGMKVGIYFFTQAITEKEAEEEAEMALALTEDYALDLPVFIDSENAVRGRANDLDKDTRTKVLKAFCEAVTQGGRQAGVYASKNWYYHKVNASELEQYCIWVAQYNTVCDYRGKMDYWQYSSKEMINGIVGNVDVNMVYTNQ